MTGVEHLVVLPHLPGLAHLHSIVVRRCNIATAEYQVCVEAAALEAGLGEVPGPRHPALPAAGLVVPDVGQHLSLDGVPHLLTQSEQSHYLLLHLLSEYVGEDAADSHHHHQQQHEDEVGQQQALDLLEGGEASKESKDDDDRGRAKDDVCCVWGTFEMQ